MSENEEALIVRVESIARSGNQAEALSLARELVETYPKNFRVWTLRAYLYGREKEYLKATEDLTQAIEINGLEPDLFFNRGSYLFQLGKHEEAVKDFTKGLELCDFHRNDYYRDTLLFWRAEAFLRLGRTKDALVDLQQVPDDFQFWTYKLRRKADLMREARATI